MTWRHWLQVVFQNRATIFQIMRDALGRKFMLEPRRVPQDSVAALSAARGADSAD